MPGRVSVKPLAKFRQRNKSKRRTSVATRAKYAPKTARANRGLIQSNARAIQWIKKQIPPNIICDYQYSFNSICEPSVNPDNPPTQTTSVFPLTSFQTWIPTLRRSQLVERQAATTIYRMTWNFRYQLNQSYWAQYTMFIVTLKKDASNRFGPGSIPLQAGDDFIVDNEGYNPFLNPAIYHIVYTRNMSLSRGTFGEIPNIFNNPGATPVAATGNGASTVKTGRVTLKKRMRIRNPISANPWREFPLDQLPHYQKMYLITFMTQESRVGETQPVAEILVNQWCSTMNPQ